ncbi:MAG: hypothetical protein M1830_000184 [Pleopsidium flavum]|nr:MAG: hypothetical protein M1830_000184 [Pleopsidium flavum]
MFTTGPLPPNFPRFQTRKALFILDLQNDFISVDGKLPVNKSSGFVHGIKSLVPVFRGSGDIIWIRSEFDESSFTPDPQDRREAFTSDDDLLPRAAGSEDDNDLEGKGEKDRESEAVEEDNQSEEEEAEELDDVSSHSSASSPGSLQSASRRPSQRAQGLLDRISARVNAIQCESLPSVSDKQENNEAFLTSLGNGQASMCCVPGTWGTEFVDDIKGTADELNDRFIVKSKYSAFDDTDLLLHLRTNFVTELYICGSLSHVSVYATAADAVRHGFTITVVEDCLGYRDEARHMEAMRQMADVMGADGITSTELIEEIVGNSHEQEEVEDRTKAIPGIAHNTTIEMALRTLSENASLVTTFDATPARPIATENGRSFEGSTTGMDADASRESKPIAAHIHTAKVSFPSTARQRVADKELSDRGSTSMAGVLSQGIQSHENPDHTNKAYNGRQSSAEPTIELEHQLKSKRSTAREKEDVPEARDHQGISGKADEARPRHTTQEIFSRTAVTSESAPIVKDIQSKTASAHPDATEPIVTTSSSTHISHSIPAGPQSNTLGPNDRIGEGDSRIIHNILPNSAADDVFQLVKDEVEWQAMHHRTGEVPRLVAVQGEVGVDEAVPVYRHPADESLPLQPFSPAVNMIKGVAAKAIQQPLNHVLIQLYRDGQDNISEHSDKTLDIVHGSSIVNMSLGAQRIMTLRTKTAAKVHNATPSSSDDPTFKPIPRETQRVPLAHNSMFVLGQATNMRWLHGVRPDKRASAEKSSAELAFSGERISLTFRRIGTFLDEESGLIWGQGARSKFRSGAGRIMDGESKEAEDMIRAFGKENHHTVFDWEAEYGSGYDVLNFVTPLPRLFMSGDHIADLRIKLCLAEKGVAWELGRPKLGRISQASAQPDLSRVNRLPKLINTDPDKSEIEGDLAILLYLDKFYDSADRGLLSAVPRPVTARVFSRIGQMDRLLYFWRDVRDAFDGEHHASHDEAGRTSPNEEQQLATDRLREVLKAWEFYAKNSQYIAGDIFTLADCAFWPILKDITETWEDWDVTDFPSLNKYHNRILRRDSVVKVLR